MGMASIRDVVEKRRIGQGAEAEVFEWEDGMVLKLRRAFGFPDRVAAEAAAMEAARSAGVPVPRAYEQVVVDGRAGLVMERVTGADLLSLLNREPWRVLELGRLTGEVHARIGNARAPASLAAVRDVTRDVLERLTRRDPSLRLEWVERILERLPDGDALCHGDFHPGQLSVFGDRVAVLDWSGAKRGEPLFDYARTRVVLSVGVLPPGSSRRMQVLAGIGRRLFLASYTRAYERAVGAPVDLARLRDWEVVNLAVRLFENLPGERPHLERRLRQLEAAATGAAGPPLPRS
jgi:aminoglycoside phosphotransferase (APT) family kinase protein